MNSFSVSAYENQPVLEVYKNWLAKDVYNNFCSDNINDPNFMQKLSFLQAEGIRHDIAVHAAVTHGSIQSASAQIGVNIQNAANLITSSLDDGFSLMNNRMLEVNTSLKGIGQGIGEVNQTLQQSNQMLYGIGRGVAQTNIGIAKLNQGIGAVASGVDLLNRNVVMGLTALNANIAQAASVLQYQLEQTGNTLNQILDELKIPESQRERRYHIEEGIKYFNKGMQSGDCLYFEDALDEFTTATSIERKDYFSWYYIGMIYLYSKENLDLEKSLSAFDRYVHYASALPQRHNLFDEALIMKAECNYLKRDLDTAYECIEGLVAVSDRAALRAAKYLSASVSEEKKKNAVSVLENLMEKNPYIIMQVLEDYDLVSNNFIIDYIKEYKRGIINSLPDTFDSVDKDVSSVEKYTKYYNGIRQKFDSCKYKFYYEKDSLGVVDLLKIKDDVLAIRKELTEFLGFAKDFHCGLAKIKEDGKWGFIDEEGSVVIPCIYQSVNDFHEDLAVVRLNGKDGIIDKKGKVVVSCSLYEFINDFSNGIARVESWASAERKFLYGLIDKTGRVICPCKWKDISTWRLDEGYAKVRDFADNWGVIDKNGNLVIPCIWKDINDYTYKDGYARVKNRDDKWGAVDINGRQIVSCKYANYGDFFVHKNYKGEIECHEMKK